jgi:hypothetical protein
MPYTARIGHPLFGVTSHLTICIVDDDTRVVLHECTSCWCEMTENYICMEIPPAAVLAPDGDFRKLNVSLRVSVFSWVVASRKLRYFGMRLLCTCCQCEFALLIVQCADSSLLHVASVGPKKILAGVEVSSINKLTSNVEFGDHHTNLHCCSYLWLLTVGTAHSASASRNLVHQPQFQLLQAREPKSLPHPSHRSQLQSFPLICRSYNLDCDLSVVLCPA